MTAIRFQDTPRDFAIEEGQGFTLHYTAYNMGDETKGHYDDIRFYADGAEVTYMHNRAHIEPLQPGQTYQKTMNFPGNLSSGDNLQDQEYTAVLLANSESLEGLEQDRAEVRISVKPPTVYWGVCDNCGNSGQDWEGNTYRQEQKAADELGQHMAQHTSSHTQSGGGRVKHGKRPGPWY